MHKNVHMNTCSPSSSLELHLARMSSWKPVVPGVKRASARLMCPCITRVKHRRTYRPLTLAEIKYVARFPEFRVHGSGFRVQGAGCRVQGEWCRVQGSGFRSQGLGFRMQGSLFRVQVAGCRVHSSGCRVQGSASGCRVQTSGFGFRPRYCQPPSLLIV